MVIVEPKERYRTRRHWHEICAEVSDFVWWSAIIITVSIALSKLIDRRAGWLILLCFYALGHMLAELIRWSLDWYAVVDMPNGSTVFRQITYTITLGGLNERVKEDSVIHLAPTIFTTAFGRFLGFQSVVMSSATKQYFDGERVPIELMKELRRFPAKRTDDPLDDERAMIVSHLGEWIQDGLVDKGPARALVASMIKDNI